MVILGLTGSIGMGKSFAARAFAREGAAVFSADEAVHRLLGPGGAAVAAVARLCPDAVRAGPAGRYVDRAALGARVFADARALAALEAALHPKVHVLEKKFLARAARAGAALAVLEIPLLFETGADQRCDYTAVVSAPASVQRRRVLARRGMTPAKLDGILSRQLSDAAKRRRADFVIPSGQGRASTLRAVRRVVRMLKARRGRKWLDRRLWCGGRT